MSKFWAKTVKQDLARSGGSLRICWRWFSATTTGFWLRICKTDWPRRVQFVQLWLRQTFCNFYLIPPWRSDWSIQSFDYHHQHEHDSCTSIFSFIFLGYFVQDAGDIILSGHGRGSWEFLLHHAMVRHAVVLSFLPPRKIILQSVWKQNVYNKVRSTRRAHTSAKALGSLTQ